MIYPATFDLIRMCVADIIHNALLNSKNVQATNYVNALVVR